MNNVKYLMALWVAIAVYSLSSITIGPRGLIAYDGLIQERDRLRANMEELQSINRNLEGSMDALRYDSDTLSVYARELGYGGADENFVRIVGLPGAGKKRVSAGQLMVGIRPQVVPEKTLRLISIAVGFTLCAGFAVSGFRRRKEGPRY
ncbi:septum formation initiator family protein [Breznakiella homolactica]|uniref:Septum formation initiator family protein n=1 Tax=Breznakiella homolactica TaxID=2798577 RepID=A0A7T8B947_9SPIR|nr:septum formation initiator family protein [Breznakiella homolactica]QQO07971.1 septum formation initiator family protein [Breznakiella homolactica]